MRLFSDAPNVLIPGQWRPCPDGARIYTAPTVFRSSVYLDQPYGDDGGLGEIPAAKWPVKPEVIPALKGTGWCGSAATYISGDPLSRQGSLVLDVDGLPVCCPLFPDGAQMIFQLVGGSPRYELINLAELVGADGFVLTQPHVNQVRIALLAAAAAQRGIVSLDQQQLGAGSKGIGGFKFYGDQASFVNNVSFNNLSAFMDAFGLGASGSVGGFALCQGTWTPTTTDGRGVHVFNVADEELKIRSYTMEPGGPDQVNEARFGVDGSVFGQVRLTALDANGFAGLTTTFAGGFFNAGVFIGGTLTVPVANIPLFGPGVRAIGDPVYQPISSDLSAIASFSGTDSMLYRHASGDWQAVTVSGSLSFSGGILSAPSPGTGTVTSVGITPPAAGITVAGSPVTSAGAMTLALADDLAALEALTGTNTIYYRSAANVWTAVTIGSLLSFSGGTLSATAQGTVTSVGITPPAAGITVAGSPVTGAGAMTLALADDLAALEALTGTNTIYYRSAANVWTAVTIGSNLSFSGGTLSAAAPGTGTVTSVGITPPAAGITVAGSPVTSAGAMTLALANDLAALEALGSTGFAVRSAADTWVQRTITSGNGIAIVNGTGVGGNTVISVSLATSDLPLFSGFSSAVIDDSDEFPFFDVASGLNKKTTALSLASYCVPPGTVMMNASNTTPAGWLRCDGSAVSRTTYAALFAAIASTWGDGDHSTTFNVPNMASRVPIGVGTGSGLSPRTLATGGGVETVTLGITQIPSHAHQIKSSNASTLYNYNGGGANIVNATTGGDGVNPWTSETAGSGLSHDNMTPFMGIGFIIKY